jgi:hypothetical protein
LRGEKKVIKEKAAPLYVIPAKAGIQFDPLLAPAFAGATTKSRLPLRAFWPLLGSAEGVARLIAP